MLIFSYSVVFTNLENVTGKYNIYFLFARISKHIDVGDLKAFVEYIKPKTCISGVPLLL